jgi:hypothetical protein
MGWKEWIAATSRLPAFACLLLLTGCTNPSGTGGFDPLVGGSPLPRTGAGGSGTGGALASRSTTPAAPAPLPVPSSATSQAALAAGTNNPSLDPSRDLRIGGGAPTPVLDNGSWRGPAGATLRQPEPVPEGKPRAEAIPVLGTGQSMVTLTSTGNASEEYRQLQAQLQARGVTWQRLETWGENGDWKFSCSIPNRQNPNIRRNYEAIAHGDLAAVRAALEQIDRERR